MIKKIEFFRFNKKSNIIISKKNKKINGIENNSLNNEKEYSHLFISILNSNKSSNNNIIKSSINITNKNIKKKALFRPEEINVKHLFTSQNNINAINNNNSKYIKRTNSKNNLDNNFQKTSSNINKYHYLIKKESKNKYKNKKLKRNYTEEEKLEKIKGEKIIQNKNSKEIKNKNINIKKFKGILEKNLTEKNLKKKYTFLKDKKSQNINNKLNLNKNNNPKNDKESKNNIKTKKMDILSDNNKSLDSNKDDHKNKNEKVNYIFKQKYKNNYEIKIYPRTNLGNLLKKIESKKQQDNSSIETKSERIIKESLNIIDLFTNNNNNINKNYSKYLTIDKDYNRNMKAFETNINKDNSNLSKSFKKLFNNNGINTMSTTRLKKKYSHFEVNGNINKKLNFDSSRNKINSLLNKSENIKIKINHEFKKEKRNKIKINNNIYNKKIEYLDLNIKNKSNIKKIVRIKIRNINGIYKNDDKKLNENNHNISDNEISFYDEESNNYKNTRYYSLPKNNSIIKKNYSQIKLSKERDIRKREHKTMRDNFESISKKLLVLVNNFHNGSQYGNQKSQNIYPEKLIDRIRTIKKLKNI